MIKKALAIILILVISLTMLTACSTDTSDQITQIENDLAALIKDASEVALQYAQAIAQGVDLSQIADQFTQVMSAISNFTITSLSDLSSTALDGVLAEINNLATALDDLKNNLLAAISGTSTADDATSQSLDQILSQLADLQTALDQVLSLLELMNPGAILE